MESARVLHQGARKLNDQFFIIKARAGESGAVVYHAYSPKTSVQVLVPFSPEDLLAILGALSPQLFSESTAERKLAHQTVIDSLQFEDRMLAQSGAAAPASPRPPPLGDAAALEGPASPSRLTFAEVEAAGVMVLRVGRKLNGIVFGELCAFPYKAFSAGPLPLAADLACCMCVYHVCSVATDVECA